MKRLSLVPLLLVSALACSDQSATQNTQSKTSTDVSTAAPTATVADATTVSADTAGTTATAPAAPAQQHTAPDRTPQAVAGPKLVPVDEGPSDPTFASYREKLLDAVRRHDADAVVALSDPAVRTSFGAEGGAKALRKSLEREELWKDLAQLLQLGGNFRGEGTQRMFWAPYVYSAWPDRHDAFESLVVIAEDVPLLESSKPGARVIGRLDFDIVHRADGKGVNVETPDGRKGFVDPKFLRSPVGYRAGFRKQNGEWRMTALVAGD